MSLHLSELSHEQREQIQKLFHHPDPDLPLERLYIVLLSAAGEDVPAIAEQVNLHPINVRKWIHRYQTGGIDGLRSGKSSGRPALFTAEQRYAILRIAQANPRKLGLPFSRWSLARLREHLIGTGVVTEISAETIRQMIQNEPHLVIHAKAI